MKILDAVEVGLEVLTEVEQLSGLKNAGDTVPIPDLHLRIAGKRIKIKNAVAEVEG